MIETPSSRVPRWSLMIHSVVLLLTACGTEAVAQGSWAFAPSAYTHSPQSGVRVVQYAEHEPVEGLPDPRQTVSRYWRTRTQIPGAAGSRDTIYEVRSFGNTLGGFDAQRERGFDAQLQTLDALTPFRFNPYLFFGGTQGFNYGTPGYPAAPPGTPVPGTQGNTWQSPLAPPQPQAPSGPYPGQPGTAFPYAPPSTFVAPPYPPFPYGYGLGGGFGGYPSPWWGYGPGREGYAPGPDARRGL